MKIIDTPGKVMATVAIIVVVILFGMMLRDLYAFGVDDSFIFYRYAENAANGHGFVFNPGEPAGEGFTSWLWTVLLTLCHFVGLNVITASKVLGILFHVLGAGLLFLSARKLPGDVARLNVVGGVLAGVFLLNHQLIAHSVSGMETSLYIFTILMLTYLTASALLAKTEDLRWWLAISAAVTCVFWVRPEGLAAGGLSMLALLIANPRALLKTRVWAYMFIGLILPVALFFGAKLMIFGYLLPHSYYHKVIVNTSEYGASFGHLMRFVQSYWWLIAAAAASLLFVLLRGSRDTGDTCDTADASDTSDTRSNRKSPFFAHQYVYLYFAFFFGAMVCVYLLFYPAMNYLHRFYIPYLPLLLLLLVPLLYWAVSKLPSIRFSLLRPLPVLLVLACLVLGVNSQAAASQRVIDSWTNMVNPQIYRARLGKVMAQLPKDVVVANAEMGVIPYFSGLTCIDMAGLTDPYIAHHGLTMDYLEQRKAGLILFPRDVFQLTQSQWDKYTINYKGVFLSSRFSRNFKCLGTFAAWPGGKTRYYFYADSRSPHFDALVQWCHTHADTLPNPVAPAALAGRASNREGVTP